MSQHLYVTDMTDMDSAGSVSLASQNCSASRIQPPTFPSSPIIAVRRRRRSSGGVGYIRCMPSQLFPYVVGANLNSMARKPSTALWRSRISQRTPSNAGVLQRRSSDYLSIISARRSSSSEGTPSRSRECPVGWMDGCLSRGLRSSRGRGPELSPLVPLVRPEIDGDVEDIGLARPAVDLTFHDHSRHLSVSVRDLYVIKLAQSTITQVTILIAVRRIMVDDQTSVELEIM